MNLVPWSFSPRVLGRFRPSGVTLVDGFFPNVLFVEALVGRLGCGRFAIVLFPGGKPFGRRLSRLPSDRVFRRR